jgi:hypothetical protein
MQSHFHHGIFWRARLNLAESIGDRRGGYHRKASGFHRARQGLHHRPIVIDNHQ